MDLNTKHQSSGIIRLILLLSCACLLALSWGCTADNTTRATVPKSGRQEGVEPARSGAVNPLEAAYMVENQETQLHQGRAVQPAAPGAATRIETRVLGRPEYGDLNGDGLDDAVLLLRHDPGGSGTFYYVAAALFNGSGWQGTRAVFLGDRILPQGIEISNGVITVHYLDRRPDQPMSAPATLGVSKRLRVQNGQLAVFAQRQG